MSNTGGVSAEYRCYSKFIYNHGQKPSLTRATDSKISSVLHRFYPMLIIFDGALNNIMWMCEDICLPFIYMVMITLVIDMLSLCETSASSGKSVFGKISTLWLGMIGFVVLLYSFLYYVVTVYQDLDQYEPPTLDDIVILLESVIDKLETIRKETVSRTLRIRTWLDVLKFAIFLTPIQYVLMRYLSVRDYALGVVVCCLLVHSIWFQSTFRLFWRVLATRIAYFSVLSIFHDRKQIIYSPLIDPSTVNEKTSATIFVPYAQPMHKMSGNKLQLELLKLYPLNNVINGISKMPCPGVIAINIYIVHENQRKWKPNNVWEPKLLPYEKPKYCIELNGHLNACKSPWEYQESLAEDWEWLDDCWKPSEWAYSDSDWNVIGHNDSLEAYTRTKIWRRRVFKVFK
ncbi:hypothetical protein HG535_0H02910 [Zygotorulaspora mrakii]|uniref:Peroxin/Ferlin domain-containing protein n=1 Tax=Zygotorulaspora mrakii TaxID=42260 RepID=A0A7H9B9J3_ZYGMR|nr:uncharacterized protein HG535_0H02910 [Zygotorulaspora mrakii]QLG74964.1 hypothetical protein HG535_0H02910 [Zygotorulaspora mrakii]